jgi:hypothetical protein
MREYSIAARHGDGAEVDPVAAVDRRRAQGVPVAAACREAGISTSTYYRRRRSGVALAELAADRIEVATPPPPTIGLLARTEDRSWPFTARAPFYWDQVFAEELTDSFVRREFGRGIAKPSNRGALTALAASHPADGMGRFVDKVRRRISGRGLEGAFVPIAGAALIALVVAAAMFTVSVASDPAAWIDPAQTRVVQSASAAINP